MGNPAGVWSWTVFLPGAIAALLGVVAGLCLKPLAERIERRIWGPSLALLFARDRGCLVRTPIKLAGREYEANYVRLIAKNEKERIAKSCSVWLTKIESKNGSGTFQDTAYSDTIRLAWAPLTGPDSFQPRDIPQGVNQMVDLVWAYPLARQLQRINSMQVDPFSYREIWDRTGTFRFTVVLTADGAAPVARRVVVDWGGDWNKIKASDGGDPFRESRVGVLEKVRGRISRAVRRAAALKKRPGDGGKASTT